MAQVSPDLIGTGSPDFPVWRSERAVENRSNPQTGRSAPQLKVTGSFNHTHCRFTVLTCCSLSDSLITMKTTLTDFQRNFRVARAAADRGETVTVESGPISYVFVRAGEGPKRPFADLEPLFGAVRLKPKAQSNRETIRQRLKARRPD